MNEPVPTPLKIDLRLILEVLVTGLSAVFVGIAALDLEPQLSTLLALGITTMMAMINRMLGKNATDSVEALRSDIKRLQASIIVYQAETTPAIQRKADDAAAQVGAAVVTVVPA